MGRRASAGTPASALLAASETPYTVHTYDHDAREVASGLGYGAEAARALGVDPARVLKTLVVALETALPRQQLAVAVLPVATRLDLKATAAALGARHARMADQQVAERATGYVAGGISPLAQRRALPTVVDSSVLEHATVLVSGGRRGMDVELAPTDLITLTGAATAAISVTGDR